MMKWCNGAQTLRLILAAWCMLRLLVSVAFREESLVRNGPVALLPSFTLERGLRNTASTAHVEVRCKHCGPRVEKKIDCFRTILRAVPPTCFFLRMIIFSSPVESSHKFLQVEDIGNLKTTAGVESYMANRSAGRASTARIFQPALAIGVQRLVTIDAESNSTSLSFPVCHCGRGGQLGRETVRGKVQLKSLLVDGLHGAPRFAMLEMV
jgi:hypothetical protein